MILRLILHLEWHPGYGATVSLHRAPRHGDRALNGGQPGTLTLCPLCEDGMLHTPDTPPQPTPPTMERP